MIPPVWHSPIAGIQPVSMATTHSKGTHLRLSADARPGSLSGQVIIVVDVSAAWVRWRFPGTATVHQSSTSEWRALTAGSQLARFVP